ncbi:YjzC family protein [bacterium]|nr:YjzC family protein [bacterium]
MAEKQKPGETPNKPGEYVERGPRGGQVPDARQVTIETGDKPLPPTQEPGRTWERVGPPKPDKDKK